MCSRSLFLFTAAHFHLGAASIFRFLTTAITVSCFLSDEIRLLCFFFLSLFHFLCYPRRCRLLKFSRKDSALLLFFLSESSGSHASYRQNARVLHPGLHEGVDLWTYVRMYGFVRTKLSWMHR